MKNASTAVAKPIAHHWSKARGGGNGNARIKGMGGHIMSLIHKDAVNELQIRVSELKDGLRERRTPKRFHDRGGYLLKGDDAAVTGFCSRYSMTSKTSLYGSIVSLGCDIVRFVDKMGNRYFAVFLPKGIQLTKEAIAALTWISSKEGSIITVCKCTNEIPSRSGNHTQCEDCRPTVEVCIFCEHFSTIKTSEKSNQIYYFIGMHFMWRS